MDPIRYVANFVHDRYQNDRLEAITDAGFFAGLGLIAVGQIASVSIVTYTGAGTIGIDGTLIIGKYLLRR